MKKVLYILLVALLCIAPLAADNQIVDSPRAKIMNEDTRVYNVLPESYSEQLGLASVNQSNLDSQSIATARLLTASSDATYPVTPGDVYTLVYTNNSVTQNIAVKVPSIGDISIPSIGTFSWRGKNFNTLKDEIEGAIRAFYPYSNPLLTISSTGAFQVLVTGEVDSASRVNLWGLSRLSDTAYLASSTASTRKVTVIHLDGSADSYDLYKALKEGVEDENPLLAPGDRVVYERRGSQVIIAGAVERPGTYQIQASDNLDTLIGSYSKGFLPAADKEDITLQRYSDGTFTELIVSSGDKVALNDGDIIYVSSVKATLGSVTLEGALLSTNQNSSFVQGNSDSRYFFRFALGDTILDMVSAMNEFFTPSSDLEGVYMIRDGASIALNFSQILHGNDKNGDIILKSGDRFIIPFNQLIVTVNGAVNKRGTYGYVPGKNAGYYIALAGGASSDAKKKGTFSIINKYGEKLDVNDTVPAEAVITVDKSNFTTDLAIAVSVIGVVSTITTIILNSLSIASQAL